MKGITHRAGGTLAALVAFEIMREKGLLIPDVNNYIQFAMMYPFASWGSIAPDLDHGRSSIPDRDPVSLAINSILRKMGTKHRSWQTHSILVTGGFLIFLHSLVWYISLLPGYSSDVGWIFLRIATMGLIVGVGSHLILDALTPSGIWLGVSKKIRLVPRSSFFATGGKWEDMVLKVLYLGIIVMLVKIGLVS